MIRLISAALFCFIVFSWGCNSQQGNNNIKELRTIIVGEIVDYKGHFETAEFSFRDILDERKNHIVTTDIPIDKDGTFRIDTIIPFPQEITTEYGSIYCYPGDSLKVTIEYFNISDVKGTSGELNNNLREFFKELPRYIYGSKEYKDTIYDLSPLAYREHVQQREQAYFHMLANYKSENTTSSEFDKWAIDILKSESWFDLILYLYAHSYRNDLEVGDLEIPDSFFSFLEDEDLWEFKLCSENRIQFLEAYYQYTFMKSKDLAEEARRYFDQQDTTSGVEVRMKMIESNSEGLVRELFYTRYYYSYLRMKDIRFFDKYYNPELIINESFKALLDTEYKSVQQYLQNLSTPGANIVTSFEDINSNVLKSILESYRGRVVYIDFWAPWCSPCMKEMDYSKQIQEYYKDEEVTFLFLANSCNEETWKATIANKGLTGDHILLTSAQYSELRELFEIGGIPHYAIIDRKGNIVSKDAFRPSSEDYLKKELNRLLMENRL